MPALLDGIRQVRVALWVLVVGLLVAPQLIWWEVGYDILHPLAAWQRSTVTDEPWTLGNISTATTEFTPPFRTHGRQIVDANESRLKLASVNWYGASDIHFVPTGLDVRHRDGIARLIRDIGFNSVRLPYSDEMVRDNPVVDAAHIAANPDLFQMGMPPRALDVFWAVVKSLTAAGILVIVNNHITQATWCCDANPCDATWANDWFLGGWPCRVRQTEADWIDHWETVMRPLASNPLVLGADLRNEVRALWGTLSWDTWAAAAERVGERLLALNGDWLIFVEGVSSANDLSEVGDRPVRLSRGSRVVYSAHVYEWSGWGSLAPFARLPYDQFAAAMLHNWAYLLRDNSAPVWVGEMGLSEHPTAGGCNYWAHLVRFLGEVDASWGYWALNARKPWGEREGYGLVNDAWDAPRCDYRLADLHTLGLQSDSDVCVREASSARARCVSDA